MLGEKILELKKEKNAVILVHNYQLPEIYDVADAIGDSLELAKMAVETDADIILFCGVDFMAESAKILNPDKKVLLPVLAAQCPMASMVNVPNLTKAIAEHPEAAVVSYINTHASTKALSYCCCTSANVVKIVNAVPFDEIIMVPDQNLARYAQRFTDKKLILWDGFCYVHHHKFSPEVLIELKKLHPDAITIVHPECPPDIIDLADEIHSTSGMMRFAKTSLSKKFIIGTEIGMIERLKKECPDKDFFSANGSAATCIQMKKNTLQSVYDALNEEKHEVTVPEDIIIKAKKALDRMIEFS